MKLALDGVTLIEVNTGGGGFAMVTGNDGMAKDGTVGTITVM